MNLEVDQPWQRFNWTFTVGPRLDTAPEIYHLWGPDKPTVTAENAGEKVHLRVEVQVLARLPRSHGVLFSIRTYLIRLDELATNPGLGRTPAAGADLPPRRDSRLQRSDRYSRSRHGLVDAL